MEPQARLGARIIITGRAGSGKTSFGSELASVLRRKVIRLDPIVIDGAARRRPEHEISTALERVARDEKWILEGAPGDIPQHALNHATAVIWLDSPRTVRAWRLFKRGFPRWLTTRTMWGGIRYTLLAPAAESDRLQRFVRANMSSAAEFIQMSGRKEVRDFVRVLEFSAVRDANQG